MKHADPTFNISLFGRFVARDAAGEPVDLSSKKVQALIGYLALGEPRSQTREKLAGVLWGEMGDERSRHNLRQALSRIRQNCHGLLICDTDRVALDEKTCTIDAWEFERGVGSDDPARIEHGLAAYRGELLEGLVLREPLFDDWLSETRRHLRRRACSAIERLTQAMIRDGRVDEAIALLRRRLELDVSCEEAHRALMGLLEQTGRRSEALRQYAECAEALQRELGAAAGPETTAVFERIRDASGAPPEEVAPSPGAPLPLPSTREPPAVAVLPFENLSSDEHRYFSDGITRDITTSLSRFGSLTVISRSSSFKFRDSDASPQQIGQELSVHYLLQGSVQAPDRRVRIHVWLLEAASGKHVWAHRFDRELEDVFAVQDEVTGTVVATLAGRVESQRLAHARSAPLERLDAYDFVLRGQDHYHRYDGAEILKAIEMFERAIERDPNYAAAHAWLACALGQAMGFHSSRFDELMERAYAAAERGRTIDDDDSECHRVLAQVFLTRKDLPAALSHSERSLQLNPNEDRTVCGQGEILCYLGRHDEAQDWVRKAMRLNPFHPESRWYHLARSFFHAKKFDDALDAAHHLTTFGTRELAYRVATAQRAGTAAEVEQAVAALRSSEPAFDVAGFVDDLPYEKQEDRALLLEALRDAGL